MEKKMLNGIWELICKTKNIHVEGTVPGSVYSILLENGKMEDPYYRTNELEALKYMEEDYEFVKRIVLPQNWSADGRKKLCFDGLDTIGKIYVNGVLAGEADNMFRQWEYDVTEYLKAGENEIRVCIASPARYIKEAYEKDPIGASHYAMKGFSHMRKAHCMFGWDWGPRLPDAGIWKDVYLLWENSARIKDVQIRQFHENGDVYISAAVSQTGTAELKIRMISPDGKIMDIIPDQKTKIPDPQLWWPNGYGEQPLYTVTVSLLENGESADHVQKKIGLRTMTVCTEKDEWGNEFTQCVNGVKIFAMGADYIPEDNIFSRMSKERTRKLLEDCIFANFNCIRVWGGGFYPHDYFYDICDELGIVVWQDFMFACANYHLTYEFEQNIRQEFIDNVKRLRHHASLGLWCGNNEMEMFQAEGEYEGNALTRSDYIRMFEHVIPEVLREYDPDTFYWPASPSSGGGFDEPNSYNRGDVHYWDVWHGGEPFSNYRKYFFRYCSEFGFQSFPCLKTVSTFTEPEDHNIFSRVMEMHQRNDGANGKIMNYLSQTYLYPSEFEVLLYASQLLQAEAIKYGVEHWRRNRERCKGAIYWQLNDIWPVASWASVDYFGRYKALHYYAKRFFAPILLSCHETGEMTNRSAITNEPSNIECSAVLNVSNETMQTVKGTVRWTLRNKKSDIIKAGEQEIEVQPLSAVWLDKIEFDECRYTSEYFSFELRKNGQTVSEGTTLFTAPKHFEFEDPKLRCKAEGNEIIVYADAYAKSVEIYSDICDFILEDNFFDMDKGEKRIKILSGEVKELKIRSTYDIK